MAERHLPGDAGEQVESERGDREDHGLRGDAEPVGVAEVADERDLIDDRQAERQQHGEDGEQRHRHALRPCRQHRRLRAVAGVEIGPAVHP